MFMLRRKTVWCLAIGLVLFAPLVHAQEAEQSGDAAGITAQVDQLFENWDKPDSPGCALSVIKDGHVVYKRGYGMANLSYDVPITPSTVFNIASVSKQFTAAAIALLAQQGKLSLDDEARKYIPKLPDFGTPITIRQLIHHLSGLRTDFVLLDLAGWRRDDFVAQDDVLNLVFRQQDLNFVPGEKYDYSNTNYILLAEIVRRVSGQSLRDFTHAHFFEPLGMKNTFFRDDYAEIVKNVAHGYLPARGDTFRLNMPTNGDVVGAGGLHTTVEDLARWDRNFYDGRVGGSVLIQQLHELGELSDGTVLADVAFGLNIATYRGLPIVEHGGSDQGYRAHLIRFPEQRFSVACLCNTTTQPSELTRRVADIYLAKELKELAPPTVAGESIELSEEQLSSMVGLYWYQENEWTRKIVLKEGKLRLFMSAMSSRFFEMEPLSANRFRLVGRPRTELHFESATAGTRPILAEDFGGVGEFRIFEPVDPFTPTPAELAEYVGTYFSEEADAVFQVAIQDDRLVLKRPRRDAASLRPLLLDVFGIPGYAIRFSRESNNEVSAMLFNGAVRNFRFTKQTP